MNDKELRYAILLNMLPGVGVRTQRVLTDLFTSFEAIFKDYKNVLEPYPVIARKLKYGIKSFSNHSFIDEEIDCIRRNNIKSYSIYDESYPESLKHILDAPVLLFAKGGLDMNNKRLLSIVGTRKPSPRARLTINEIISGLNVKDLVIVSGLAYGVDAFSHEIALEHNIPTLGVLAHGLSMIYPAYNKSLADKMIDNSNALVTEFLFRETPQKSHFPRRNRIIAGLSSGLLVIESNIKGGAMITADLAHSYHREVMAVPGRFDDATSQGCIKLIKDHKAVLVTSPNDVRDCMSWDGVNDDKPLQFGFSNDSSQKRQIYDCINELGSASLEFITQSTQIAPNVLSLSLIDMEIDGLIMLANTGQYMIARKVNK